LYRPATRRRPIASQGRPFFARLPIVACGSVLHAWLDTIRPTVTQTLTRPMVRRSGERDRRVASAGKLALGCNIVSASNVTRFRQARLLSPLIHSTGRMLYSSTQRRRIASQGRRFAVVACGSGHDQNGRWRPRGDGRKRHIDHDGAFPLVKDRIHATNAASMSLASLLPGQSRNLRKSACRSHPGAISRTRSSAASDTKRWSAAGRRVVSSISHLKDLFMWLVPVSLT
jgi:hypothetical protein